MYELVEFFKSLQPKYCALISALISLGIFVFIFIDWFVHRNYGLTLIDLIYSKLYSISWILGTEYPVSTRSKNYLNNDNAYCSGLDSKVWRNHLSLFRSCEYDLFEKETKLNPLTNYDMNFTSVDQQSFFTCYNDNFCSPEFELMAKVWRLRDKRLRILCSYKALELNSNCSPALVLLSEERAKNFETCEKILRLALKAAENNFNKSKLLIDTFDLKDDLIVNTNENSTLIDDKSSSKNKTTKLKSSPSTSNKSSFKCSDFTNLNNLMNNFKFNNIDKEVNELLKELYKEDGDEYESIIRVLNLKLNFDNNQKSDLEKEFFNLNELILNEIDNALGNLTTENLSYKNYLFTEELIRDYKILLYIKRRLGMCLRRLNKLDEALKLFRELNREVPTIGNFSCLENLMEIYLELEAYSELQLLLNKYDDIAMPKSACLVYTAALMKIRNCCEKYQNLKEPPLYSSFLSYNYFNEVNYFQSPDIHVVNTVNKTVKLMNSSTTNSQFVTTNDTSSISNNLNSSTSITNQNGFNHNSTQLKNGHNNSNGYSNGVLNGHYSNSNTNNSSTNNLINGHNSNSSTSIGSPLTNLNTNVTQNLRNEMLALEEIYRAVEFNPIIPIYLLEYKQLTLPTEHIIRRGDTEALAYSFIFLKHWKSIPGALQMLELTWKNAFKLIKNPTKKGHLFYQYPLFVYNIDRILIPDHFEVSIYPTKDSSILFMCIISAFLVFIFFLALINRHPELLTADFIHNNLFNRLS